MSKSGEKLRRSIEKILPQGESLVAFSWVELKKTGLAGAMTPVSGLVGMMVADKVTQMGAGRDWESAVGFKPKVNMVVGLTLTKLLFFDRSALNGMPKRLLGEIVLSKITGAEFRKEGFLDYSLSLMLSNNVHLNFDVCGSKDLAEELANQLNAI